MKNGLLEPRRVYRVSMCEMLPALELAQRTVHIYKKLYIRKKKKGN